MIAMVRLIVIGGIALTVVYVCLWLYGRSTKRVKLREQWNAGSLAGHPPGDYEEFMSQGMSIYERNLRRKLVIGVYVVPVTLVIAIIYLTNFA